MGFWSWLVKEKPQHADDVKHSLLAAAREFYKAWSPRIITITALAAVIVRASLGDWSWWDLALLGGILAFWPFQEWMIHVFLLHLKPRKILGITIDPLVSSKHRAHHEDPWNIEIIMVPLPAVFFTLGAVTALGYAVMPTLALTWSFIAIFLSRSLVYEWTHYLTHTRYRPRSEWYRRLWKNHRLHHCKNEHYWFGVSTTFGDRVLGTDPEERSVEKSKTCRTIVAQT